jgi:hypothetical protein
VVLAGVPAEATVVSDAEVLAPSVDSHLPQSTALVWRQALPSALWAILIATILTAVTLGSLGLGMVIAGALSVVLYRRHKPDAHLTAGMGAKLGAFTGALGCAMLLAILAVAVGVFHAGGRIHQAVLEGVQQVLSRSPDPQKEQVLEIFKTSDGFALMLTLGMIVMCIACVFFSSAGGALSAVLLRRKQRP